MAGVSKLIEARNKPLPPPPPQYDDHKKRSKKKNKEKNAKGVDDGKEEWEETQEWEKDIESDPSVLDKIPWFHTTVIFGWNGTYNTNKIMSHEIGVIIQ